MHENLARDGSMEPAQLAELLADDLEFAVAATLSERSPEPARLLAAAVIDTDASVALHHAEAADLGQGVAYLILARWIMSIQRHERQSEHGALGWVARHLGPVCAAAADLAVATLSPTADICEELGQELLPALVWLTAGLVAEYGDGDATWLRRYDSPPKPAAGTQQRDL